MTNVLPQHPAYGLYRLHRTGTELMVDQLVLSEDSATVHQLEHVTFAVAGIVEVPFE